jgi:hypothetical protein
MATSIDSVEDEELKLSTVVNRIILAAEKDDDLRSIYWQGVILTKEDCQLLAKHLMTPFHGHWTKKDRNEEEE